MSKLDTPDNTTEEFAQQVAVIAGLMHLSVHLSEEYDHRLVDEALKVASEASHVAQAIIARALFTYAEDIPADQLNQVRDFIIATIDITPAHAQVDFYKEIAAALPITLTVPISGNTPKKVSLVSDDAFYSDIATAALKAARSLDIETRRDAFALLIVATSDVDPERLPDNLTAIKDELNAWQGSREGELSLRTEGNIAPLGLVTHAHAQEHELGHGRDD